MEPPAPPPPPSSSSQEIPLIYLNSLHAKTDEKSQPYASSWLPSPNPTFANFSSPPQRSDLDRGINSIDNMQINGVNSINPLYYFGYDESPPYTSTYQPSPNPTSDDFSLPSHRSGVDQEINCINNMQINGVNSVSPFYYSPPTPTNPPCPNPTLADFSSPPQRSPITLPGRMNSSVPYLQPGINRSQNNITSYDWIETGVPCPGVNGRSEDLLQFGSRAVDANHVRIPYNQEALLPHHGTRRYLGFGTSQGYDNTNLRAFSRSRVPPNLVPYFSINQPAANSQMSLYPQEGKPVQERNTDLAAAGEISPLLNNNHSENVALIVANSTHSHSTDSVGIVSGPMQVSPLEQRIVPYTGSVSAPREATEVEEWNQGRPRIRRKTASGKDGRIKHCKCKKSKCLKLYCDCFAAGSCCSDSCTCQNCGNTDASISTVQTVRSKVCNCKNSKCKKKYCECFQGNEGCSVECRCHDCQNSFGRRPALTKAMFEITQKLYTPPNGSVNMGSTEESHDDGGNGNADQFPSGDDPHQISHHNPLVQPSVVPFATHRMERFQLSFPANNFHEPLAARSPPSGGLRVSPQSLEASRGFYGSVQDGIVSEGRAPEETSSPSNTMQPSLPNQNRVPLPLRLVLDPRSFANLPSGSRPDDRRTLWNVPAYPPPAP